MSLCVCGRIASAVGLKLNCRSDNCSAFTKTDPPTFFQKQVSRSAFGTKMEGIHRYWHLSKAILPHDGVTKKLNAGGIDYEKKKKMGLIF